MTRILIAFLLVFFTPDARALQCVITPVDTVDVANSGPIVVDSGLAHVAPGNPGSAALVIVDVEQPAAVIGTWGSWVQGFVPRLALRCDGQAAVAGSFFPGENLPRVIMVDASVPTAPVASDTTAVFPERINALEYTDAGVLLVGLESGVVTTLDGGTSGTTGQGLRDVLVVGNRTYVITAGVLGAHNFYVLDTATLALLGSTRLPVSSLRALDAGDDGTVYGAAYGPGIVSIDVDDPAQPALLWGEGITGWNGTDIRIEGNRAYLASPDYLDRLDVYDVSDPADISFLTRLGPDGNKSSVHSLDVVGNTAYLMVSNVHEIGNDVLMTVDASDCQFSTSAPVASVSAQRIQTRPSIVGAAGTTVSLRGQGNGVPPELRVIDAAGRERSRIRLTTDSGPGWTAHWTPTTGDGHPLPSGKYWLVADEAVGSILVVR